MPQKEWGYDLPGVHIVYTMCSGMFRWNYTCFYKPFDRLTVSLCLLQANPRKLEDKFCSVTAYLSIYEYTVHL